MDFETIDIAGFSHDERYKFLRGAVIPRPIALISSLDETGRIVNAAPFSQFMIVGTTPPLFAVVVGGGRNRRDTYDNIVGRRECVVNIVDVSMGDQVQQCAFPYPSDVSEVEEVGFDPVPSSRIATPRILQSPLQFECVLHEIVHVGPGRSNLVVLEVVVAHARAGLVERHRVNHESLNALGRIAGRRYCTTANTIDVP